MLHKARSFAGGSERCDQMHRAQPTICERILMEGGYQFFMKEFDKALETYHVMLNLRASICC
jgi:hypothetical protein